MKLREAIKSGLTYIAVGLLLTTLYGCTVTRTVEEPPGSGNLKKVAETDPRFTQVTDTIGAVNTATSPINPWHGLVTIGLAAATAIAEWNRRRKQAVIDAVVSGVEVSGSTEAKQAIQKAALAQGVEATLNKTVQRVTGG